LLPGKALSALGKKEDALVAWKQGHEIAVHDTMDLKQLLELEELISSIKFSEATKSADHVMDASPCDTKVVISEDRIIDMSSTATTTADTKTIVCEEGNGSFKVSLNTDTKSTSSNNKVDKNKGAASPVKEKDTTGALAPKKAPKPDKKNKAKATKETNGRAEGGTERRSSGESEVVALGQGQTMFATKISKSSKSMCLDFRLSRGIGQVCTICYGLVVSELIPFQILIYTILNTLIENLKTKVAKAVFFLRLVLYCRKQNDHLAAVMHSK
jgi:hypothetical protein